MEFALVYQAGIANIFRTDSGTRVRVYQGDFRTAEAMALGMGICGAEVTTYACNRAGDIADATWTEDLDSQPFSDRFRPVRFSNGLPLSVEP